LGGAGHGDLQRRRDLALGEQADAVPHAAQQTGRDQRRAVDRRIGLQPAGLDGLLQAAEIDLVEFLAERRIGEATLRHSPMERRLAAFEAVERDAGACRLALAAAAARLAFAGPDAATDPLEAVMGAGIVPDLVEFHISITFSPPPRRAPSTLRPEPDA